MNKNCLRFFICLFIFFLEVAQAQDSHIDSTTAQTCHPNLELIPKEFTDIMETLSIEPMVENPYRMGYKSASDQDIFHAPCRKEAPSLEEMEDWLDVWASASTTQVNVETRGKIFEGENSKMIWLFKKLNGAGEWSRSIRFKYASYGSHESMSECRKVICVMKHRYGEKQGVQLLYLLAKYGLNGSPLASNKVRNFSTFWFSYELDKVISALSDLPEEIFPLKKIRPLVRYRRGNIKEACDGGFRATDYIKIFDCASHKSYYQYQRTVVHEVAHVIGDQEGFHHSSEWLSFAGWENTDVPNGSSGFHSNYEYNNRNCLVSRYGEKNHKEDFAESVAAYRYNPERVKEKCPQKYDYLKEKVFNGWEYVDDRCFKSEESNSS